MRGRTLESLVTVAGRRLAPAFDTPEGWRPPPPRRVLLLKPCCVGDLVFTTPAIRELRRGLPGSRIELAVGAWSRPVVEHNPHLDALVDLDGLESEGLDRARLLRLVRELRARRYDWCLTFDRSPLLALVPALAGIPLRAGLDSAHRGFASNRRVPSGGVRHEADLYLDLIRSVGIEPQDGATEHEIGPDDAAWAARTLDRLAATGRLRRPLIALHPGGGRNPGMTFSAKQWPIDRYAALTRLALHSLGATVLLLGGAADADLAAHLRGALGERDDLTDLTGVTSLGQLAALAARADAFVGNDTGPSHLAVAVGTPSVLIFGPSDPRRYGPRRPNGAVVWAPADMARHLRLDPRHPHRLGAIAQPPAASVELVWSALRRALLTGRTSTEPGAAIWPLAGREG